MPKTVHINAISAYHFGVFLGGMGLVARNPSRKVVFGGDAFDAVFDCWEDLVKDGPLLFPAPPLLLLFQRW